MLTNFMFDAISSVQRVICLVAFHAPPVVDLIALVGAQFGGHFLRDRNKLVHLVPIEELPQIDGCYYVFHLSFRHLWAHVYAHGNGKADLAESGSEPRDTLSQSGAYCRNGVGGKGGREGDRVRE